MMNILNKWFYRRSEGHFRFLPALWFCGALLAASLPVQAGAPGSGDAALKDTASTLKPYAAALGHRLQKPGKYKIAAAGTLTCQDNAAPQPASIRITWQYPMKIKLEQAGDSLAFDRRNPAPSVMANRAVANVVQVLLEDSVEGIFALLQGGAARRYIGSGFRLEGSKESDPGVDVLLLSYPDIFQRKKVIQKAYWFDSHTKLLGVVGYTSPSGLATHVLIEDWRDIGGEKIPFRIERWENNKRVLQLNLESAVVLDDAEDGTLGGN
jgi:hypothetical protein